MNGAYQCNQSERALYWHYVIKRHFDICYKHEAKSLCNTPMTPHYKIEADKNVAFSYSKLAVCGIKISAWGCAEIFSQKPVFSMVYSRREKAISDALRSRSGEVSK